MSSLIAIADRPLGAIGLNYTAVNQTVQTTKSRCQNDYCFVALIDNILIGTITLKQPYYDDCCAYYQRNDVASIHQFAVDPTFQKYGISSRLLFTAENYASELGFQYLGLDTAENAKHLVSFYQNRGYLVVDTVNFSGKKYRSLVLSKSLK